MTGAVDAPVPGRPDGAAAPEAVRVLGCRVDLVDMPGAVELVASHVEAHRRGSTARGPRGGGGLVVTLNAEIVMRARREPDFRALVDEAALVIPDGAGVVRALRRRGHGAVRVPGVELVEAYARVAALSGHRLALAGAGPGVAARAAAELGRRHPGLTVVAADPGRPDGATAARLAEARPDVVLAAYGAGRQERFIAEWGPVTGAALGIGVGGSLDYLAGTVARAPLLLRRLDLEWAWRLVRQPWRVRRQMALPAFWWLERRDAARERALTDPAAHAAAAMRRDRDR